ncbi:uncharacterized protein K444DRAFT_533107, partial [Hyaloscypha bicolor E]
WPSNLPNLNTIKPIWFYIKKETIKRELTGNRKKLREWIKAIPYYIKEVIRLKEGNEYKEEQKKGQEKEAVYN